MTEQKNERRTKVYCRNNIWLENEQKRPMKVKKGYTVMLTSDEIKHFGKAVTKDVPEGAEPHEHQ